MWGTDVAVSSTVALRAVLERLGATFRKGRLGYIAMTAYGNVVALSGPPHEEPRRWWRGSAAQALELLTPPADGVGLDSVWETLHA